MHAACAQQAGPHERCRLGTGTCVGRTFLPCAPGIAPQHLPPRVSAGLGQAAGTAFQGAGGEARRLCSDLRPLSAAGSHLLLGEFQPCCHLHNYSFFPRTLRVCVTFLLLQLRKLRFWVFE